MKVYIKVLITDVTDNVMQMSIVPNIFLARKSTDGLYVLLTFIHTNIPVELFIKGYLSMNKGEMRQERLSGWDGN